METGDACHFWHDLALSGCRGNFGAALSRRLPARFQERWRGVARFSSFLFFLYYFFFSPKMEVNKAISLSFFWLVNVQRIMTCSLLVWGGKKGWFLSKRFCASFQNNCVGFFFFFLILFPQTFLPGAVTKPSATYYLIDGPLGLSGHK